MSKLSKGSYNVWTTFETWQNLLALAQRDRIFEFSGADKLMREKTRIFLLKQFFNTCTPENFAGTGAAHQDFKICCRLILPRQGFRILPMGIMNFHGVSGKIGRKRGLMKNK